MKTQNRQYELPNQFHDVVEDINSLRETFGAIDADVKNCEIQNAALEETIENLENQLFHVDSSLVNTEIQSIAPNRFLISNATATGFECVDGGGDPGGNLGDVSIKKSNENYDSTWGDFFEISSDGMTPQENSETSQSNETHIFCDSAEIENENQLPRVNLTDAQTLTDVAAERNESFILVDSLEQQTEREEAIATHENFGLVKIGSGIENNNGTISYSPPGLASAENFGIAKIGDGLNVSDGVISKQEIAPATFLNFGVVKLGEGLVLNSNGEMEIEDMANAGTIYNLGNVKICSNGIVDLEEQTLRYRLFVTEDLVVQFKTDFEPQADFSFMLEIISDGKHLVSFDENLRPTLQQLTLNRGTTRISFTKQIGMPFYDTAISQLDAFEPELLTAREDVISKFLVTAPNGGNWNPSGLLQDYYDNAYSDIRELYFEFFTFVCVDYVKYWSRSSSVAMNSFIFRGSNDGKNWTTLLYKENEICYGKVYTERKGCFRFYRLTINYSGDDNKPGGVMLFGTQIDNNGSEVINLTPYMSSNSTNYATLSASNISSGSAADLTDTYISTYMRVTSDVNSTRWIKYELTTPEIVNLVEFTFYNTNTQANWFKLEGSNDDENYTLLLERQYQGNLFFNNGYKVTYYHLQNTTAYKYYKLTCVATNDSSDNWDLYGFKIYSIKTVSGVLNFRRGVPTLSSANQDGYEITESSKHDSGHAGYFAFDDNTQTRWATSANSGDAWLQIKLSNATVFNAVKIAPRGDNYLDQAPSAFQIQASNDSENWDVLDSETNVSWVTLGEFKLFSFENETAYLYYRLYITANQGSSYKGCSCVIFGNYIYDPKRQLQKYNSLVPTMSSNSQDGYVASASSVFGGTTHPAYCAFDNSTGENNKWLTANDDTSSAWLKIKLPEAQIANAFMLQMPAETYTNRAPKNFKIQGSNDNSIWTDLITQENLSWSNNQARTFTCENESAYQYYRIYITASNGARIIHIGEWKLYYQYYVTEY